MHEDTREATLPQCHHNVYCGQIHTQWIKIA